MPTSAWSTKSSHRAGMCCWTVPTGRGSTAPARSLRSGCSWRSPASGARCRITCKRSAACFPHPCATTPRYHTCHVHAAANTCMVGHSDAMGYRFPFMQLGCLSLWGCIQATFLGERHARPIHDPVPRDHEAGPRHSTVACPSERSSGGRGTACADR